ARLDHPALVSVHDILEDAETLWLVMDLVEGKPLDEWLQGRTCELATGLRIAVDIASGLEAIHGAGILHRDLKAKNVMITEEGVGGGACQPRARLLDFGLARAWEDSESSLTSDGDVVGTPRAMSPEQAHGRSLDARSDLFSLGALLYELFTGVSPFAAETVMETLSRVCHQEPEPIGRRRPAIPLSLERLVEELLAKEPGDRPRFARDVVTVLENLTRVVGEAGADLEQNGPSVPASSGASWVMRSRPRGLPDWLGQLGERRQLTVVCGELVGQPADLRGSSGSLDPEDVLLILPSFRAHLHAVIERFGGYLGELRSHRFEVYFGWPHAAEDDSPRALSAALELATLGERLPDPRTGATGVGLRVGLHTGPVLVGWSADGQERLNLGATWSRAIELREEAAPGQVWIGEGVERWLAAAPGQRLDTSVAARVWHRGQQLSEAAVAASLDRPTPGGAEIEA
ncbi:MAG: protein kinase, partial [Acidobacteriota bacterium]